MRRVPISPRPDWESEVEKWGLVYHTHNGEPYWCESAYYEFNTADVDAIENATNELHQRCLEAIAEVIRKRDYARFGIKDEVAKAIEWSWEQREPSLYGRFDLAYDGEGGAPKLLEYNADTPTALLEAGVVQWQWSQSVKPGADQFNSIWEHLVARWKDWREKGIVPQRVYFAHEESNEDLMTVSLLRDTAQEAGLETTGIHMEEIGWNAGRQAFVDLQEQKMDAIFKLYPWEFMVAEEFGKSALATLTTHRWIEPIWKMLLSNKAILSVLWETFNGHPNLLPTFDGTTSYLTRYAKKPILSREGANIQMVKEGAVVEETAGGYGAEGYVYQELAELPVYDGFHPVIGSWVVGDESCGVGIRETPGLITTDLARFVPNIIAG